MAVSLLLAGPVLAGCTAGAPGAPGSAGGSPTVTAGAPAQPGPTQPGPTQPGPSPVAAQSAGPPGDGALPQTTASPAASGPVFDAEMADLWRAVTTGDAAQASAAFFPLSAYLQVKTVPDPAADWRDRLLGDFTRDVAAAHDLVGQQGSAATLVGVDVPTGVARWVPPGTCANRVGYWHVAQARLVYLSSGLVRSFGIASLISWRGTWYVVHLGAVVRHGTGGVVDGPAEGRGTPGPQGGC